MNFDLAQLFTFFPALLIGLGVGILASDWAVKLYTKKKKGGVSAGEDAGTIAKLQAELDATKESQAKVNEVHEYARKLEAKVQELESTSDSADAELRVKVLEKQLSEKADLESKLAIALQQLEDYKAKAEMFDTVVGTSSAPVSEPEFEPAALEEVVAAEEPVFAEEPEVVEEPVVAGEPMVAEVEFEELMPEPVEISLDEPEIHEEPELEPLTAVALADSNPGITLVQNEIAAKGPVSPVGATAPAIDERPALRVESSVEPILDPRDPLEKIEGIGQVYQSKLYEAGIKTFAQLAAASPSRITEVIEPQNWQQIDVMTWRREAALYASGEKS